MVCCMYTVTLYSTVQQHFSTIYISMYVLIASLQYTYVNYIDIMVLEHVQCYIFPNSVYCTLQVWCSRNSEAIYSFNLLRVIEMHAMVAFYTAHHYLQKALEGWEGLEWGCSV